MESKFTVFVFYSMTGVCSALKANDDIRVTGKHICDFTLALVSPVSAYNSFYHNLCTPFLIK